MTVLGLLVASFMMQGQPFLPTFSTVSVQSEKIQQSLISNRRLSTSIAQTSHQPCFYYLKLKYHKILCDIPNKISWEGSRNLIERFEVASSTKSKTVSFSYRSFRFIPKKEWDMPQTPSYSVEERLLAQYYRGESLPVLRYGNTGNAVRVLQTLLTYNRYGVGITGRFDVLTETAVKAFQENRRLGADGIVGPRTWRELTRRSVFRAKRDPMEIPLLGNQPLYPWQRSEEGKFTESTVSI